MRETDGLSALQESPGQSFAHSCRLLHRIDPARNMRRFYRLEILPDLFGGVILKREWGRIGARGQSKARWFDDPRLASAALLGQARRKVKRGYFAPEQED
jgi:predicted DNA-binding WGR domain protein